MWIFRNKGEGFNEYIYLVKSHTDIKHYTKNGFMFSHNMIKIQYNQFNNVTRITLRPGNMKEIEEIKTKTLKKKH